MAKLKKSSPECSYYHKICAFFKGDPDIDVGEMTKDEDDYGIESYDFTITVHDARKYSILEKALYVPEMSRLDISIECDALPYVEEVSEADLAYLLKDNPYFAQYVDGEKSEIVNGLKPKMKYVMMKPKVVQYYDDIMNNPVGFDTKTAEQLAKELFHGSHCNITSSI